MLRKGALFARERLSALKGDTDRFGYIGAHHKGNLGDDATFLAARAVLGPAALTTYGPPLMESVLTRLGTSGPRHLDAVVLGGGTLVNPLWLEQVQHALRGRLPVWSLGTGVGSCGFEQEWHIELPGWPDLLSQFKGISVRGPRSKRALQALGVEGAKVTGDLGLSLALDHLPAPNPKRRIAVNLTIPPGKKVEDFAIVRAIRRILVGLASQGWEVVPVIMHPWDARPVRYVVEALPVLIEPPPRLIRTPEEFFRLVGPCRLTIAGRLHAAVLSCCAGVPPLKVVYRDKCLDFMESMGVAQWCVKLEDEAGEDISVLIRELIDSADDVGESVWRRAREWKSATVSYVREMVASRLS